MLFFLGGGGGGGAEDLRVYAIRSTDFTAEVKWFINNGFIDIYTCTHNI